MDRTVRRKAQQRCNQVSQHAGEQAAVDFFNLLAGPELLAKTEEHLPQYRERLYPPTVALASVLSKNRWVSVFYLWVRIAFGCPRSDEVAVSGP